MAFKLNKDEKARRDQLVKDLQEHVSKLEDAVNVYNDETAKLRAPVETALAAYNEIAEQARGFAEDIANQADSDISDKSEKWQEGERGQAATEWKDAWEGIDISEVEVEWPEDLTIEAPSHADDLEQLPEEAG